MLVTVENESDVTAVFKSIYYLGYNSTEFNCIVDIVANHGLCWIKVTARNASALHRIWQGTVPKKYMQLSAKNRKNINIYIYIITQIILSLILIGSHL